MNDVEISDIGASETLYVLSQHIHSEARSMPRRIENKMAQPGIKQWFLSLAAAVTAPSIFIHPLNEPFATSPVAYIWSQKKKHGRQISLSDARAFALLMHQQLERSLELEREADARNYHWFPAEIA
jgi:hypothetical protein